LIGLLTVGLVAAADPDDGDSRGKPAPTAEPAATFLPYSRPGVYPLDNGATIEVSSFHSLSLERDMPYAVVLPPGYQHTTRRYAVLVMLHGLAGGYGSWLELGLHEAFGRLYEANWIDPFIIVLPEGGESFYFNHANDGPRWGDYISQDLVRHIDRTYRTRASPASRAIGGLSMGGEGALQLALNYPGVFDVVGAHTPTTRLYYADAPDDIYGEPSYWRQHNSLWLILHTDTVFDLRIWIDDGEEDDWLASAESLHEALDERGLAHYYRIYPGAHDYWADALDDYLMFYAAELDTKTPNEFGARRRGDAPWAQARGIALPARGRRGVWYGRGRQALAGWVQ
jgi:S-formylglutathione hydrolase FrmB